MEQPLVTVVMPCYNHAAYVGRAIESVLKQTYTNFEFIIGDDASTDQSVEIIKQYTDPRIQLITFEENIGFGACEYIYTLAKGKYIASICSDDMWVESLLEKYIAFMEAHEEYGSVFCIPDIIDENDTIVPQAQILFQSENTTQAEWFKRLYLTGNCICGSTMCLRRSMYDQLGGFRFQYRQLQDYEYWLRLLQIKNIYIYPESLAMYRLHYNNENPNISMATPEVQLRDMMERKYIMFDIMENMDPEFFLHTFRDMLILPPESEGFCLDCEKFAVMIHAPAVPAHASVFYYFKHYNDPVFRYHIETYYGVSRKAFWNLTGSNIDPISR